MAFKGVIYKLVKALKEGTYLNAGRADVDDKNALATGEISADELILIVTRCNGSHHDSSPHHEFADVEVHILKRDGWYIKFYFADPDTIFISVHQ